MILVNNHIIYLHYFYFFLGDELEENINELKKYEDVDIYEVDPDLNENFIVIK